MSRLDGLRTLLSDAVAGLPAVELPELIGVIEAAKAAAWVRLTVPPLSVIADELVDAVEMSRRASMPEHWVRDQGRRWIKSNGAVGIPAIKTGHYLRFDPAAVLAAIRNRISSLAQPEKPSNGAGRCPSVSKTSRPNGAGGPGANYPKGAQ